MKPEDVHPSHDVREEGLLISDPVCQQCRLSIYENEERLRAPCNQQFELELNLIKEGRPNE